MIITTLLIVFSRAELANRMKEVIEARQHARTEPRARYRCYGATMSSEEKVYNLITKLRFIDKTRNFNRAIQPRVSQNDLGELAALLVVFAQRFGKTTLLSFVFYTLSLCHELGMTTYKNFLDKLHVLEEGDEFLNAPVHPVIRLSLLGVDTAETLFRDIKLAFEAEKVTFDDLEIGNWSVKNLLNEGMTRLKTLWERAVEKLPKELRSKDLVTACPILLIDEFDLPARKMALEKLTSKTKRGFQEVSEMLHMLGEWIKINKSDFFRIIVVSLLRLGHTGLSSMRLYDASHSVWGHGLVGITKHELEMMLTNLSDKSDCIIDVASQFEKWYSKAYPGHQDMDSAVANEEVSSQRLWIRQWRRKARHQVRQRPWIRQRRMKANYRVSQRRRHHGTVYLDT